MSTHTLSLYLLLAICALTSTWACQSEPNALCMDATCGLQVQATSLRTCNCSASDIGYALGACTSGTRTMTFFWKPPASCLNGVLPSPISGVPCDLKCPAGQKINYNNMQCEDCPIGTSSSGPSIQWNTWDEWPVQMATYCTSSLPGQTCSAWRLLGTTIDSGNNFNKNSIASIIQLRLNLVEAGNLYFEYKVSSEERFDGLSLVVDDLRLMYFSNKNWTSANYSLAAGYHDVKWMYSKDYSEARGDDRATIRAITITGLSRGQISCQDCPPGKYASATKSSSCFTCGANTRSEFDFGSTKCIPCSANEYAPPGSSKCIPRTDCSEVDMTWYYTPCIDGQHNKTFAWIQPSACDIANSTLPTSIVESCSAEPTCLPGQVIGDNNQCQYCPSGTHATETSSTLCVPCQAGSASGPRTAVYEDFNPATMWLDGTFSTDCTNCYSGGWRAAYNFIDSGAGVDVNSESTLRFKLNMTHAGNVTLNMTMSCPIESSLAIRLAGHNVVLQCSGCNVAPQMVSVPVDDPGLYFARITYHHAAQSDRSCSRATVNSITVVGSSIGGATQCDVCQAGTYTPTDRSDQCLPCSPGTTSAVEASQCSTCADGTFAMQGWGECVECGMGTTTTPDRSDCAYNCSQLLVNGIEYDISSLKAVQGPIAPDNSTTANSTSLYLSLCGRMACVEPDTNATTMTFACSASLDAALSLGNAPNFEPLPDPEENRGLLVTFSHGDDGCKTVIQLRCDLNDFDGTLEFLNSTTQPGKCVYHWQWNSYFACPLCVAEDYTTYTTPCTNGKQQKVWVNTHPGQCRDGVPKPLTIQSDCKEEVALHYTTVVVMSVIAGVVLVAGIASLVFLYLRNKRLYSEYTQLKNQKFNVELSEDVERTTTDDS